MAIRAGEPSTHAAKDLILARVVTAVVGSPQAGKRNLQRGIALDRDGDAAQGAVIALGAVAVLEHNTARLVRRG